MIASINPATGEQLAGYEPYDSDRVDRLLGAAAVAQSNWQHTEVGERAELLRTIASTLRARKSELAALITTEMGKPLTEAMAEIEKCAVTCEYYATHAEGFLAAQAVTREGRIEYEPLGVVLAVMPWNFPFWQFFRFAAPAVAAGNGAILKHANTVPRCALAIESVLADAGMPAGLIGVVLVETEQVAGLIADDRIAAVTFTGSTEVGRIIAAQAGQALKKQVLELGGSDPFIVLADADLEAAATAAVTSRFINAGQSCVNAKRMIVEASVADRFVTLFCAALDRLVMGDPLDRATSLGPLARDGLRDTLDDQVRRTVDAGASLLRGGEAVEPGFYYRPTVLDHVQPGMAAFDEETFGPVAAIVRARDADEAIELANRTEFGLGSSLWTAQERAAELVGRIDAGAVFVNAIVASDPRLPFGGIKQSGYGRELGADGMREFMNVKTVWSADPAPRLVIRPDDVEVFDRGSGVRTVPYVGAWNSASNKITTGTTIFAVGTEIPMHSHNVEESVLVFSGQATAVIDGERVDLEAGDATWVPAGVPHQFINRGAGELTIYWVYGGREVTRTMTATGVTVAHLSASDRGAVAAAGS
ncbi:aldehyde dehydrogenase family protein [Kribbella jiaozuonensis]|uniref:Aldehyde dehydrogenase family protein n=1 Tax=Kribbella jiaozuonensis TaxID=2575441 RepID=A0A4U3LLA0_9ACTN|nr:aldehyde dehydrogenase family protein [Kribbella jiaozuonensis]TKK76272.1 aldehyde dehydrogenase family protein [Kribbella jiaozuonensis]